MSVDPREDERVGKVEGGAVGDRENADLRCPPDVVGDARFVILFPSFQFSQVLSLS